MRRQPAQEHDNTPARILGLQRQAGNLALVRLLAPVQRWGAQEHELLGDKGSGHRTVELTTGYRLSFGEVVALAGDHFEHVEQMRVFAANTKGGAGSRAEIEYALEWKLHKKGRKYDDKAKAAQEARYYTLAGKNVAHFLNPSPGDIGQDPSARAGDVKAYLAAKYTTPPQGASQAYRMNHVWAIKEAVEEAQRKGSLDRPLTVEAFGAHYLTDAFAAGHVRTPRAGAKQYWDRKVPMFVYNLTGFIAEGVAKHLGTWQKVVVPTDVTMRQRLPRVGALVASAGAAEHETVHVRRRRRPRPARLGQRQGDHRNDQGTGRPAARRRSSDQAGQRRHVACDPGGPRGRRRPRAGIRPGAQGSQRRGSPRQPAERRIVRAGAVAPQAEAGRRPEERQQEHQVGLPRCVLLLADERFKEAVKLFLKEKEGELQTVAVVWTPRRSGPSRQAC